MSQCVTQNCFVFGGEEEGIFFLSDKTELVMNWGGILSMQSEEGECLLLDTVN